MIFSFNLFDMLLVISMALLRYACVDVHPGISTSYFCFTFWNLLEYTNYLYKKMTESSPKCFNRKKDLIILTTLALNFLKSFLKSKSIELSSIDLQVEKLETTFVVIL